ncbi:MAG: hypothetical protein EAZ99_03995 [Alphaproteobacteria bacterium]|nr:MAG: hypothetical protein EAZ99_03995 [Alphaproteobacteria bacterium]
MTAATHADAVIAAIVERLSGAIAGASVQSWPDDPDKFRPRARSTEILVTIDEWTWTVAPRPTRRYSLVIALYAHSLVPGDGAQALIDAVSTSLQGWRPAGSGAIELIGAELISRTGGQHLYMIRAETAHLWATGPVEDAHLPLVRITVEGDAALTVSLAEA